MNTGGFDLYVNAFAFAGLERVVKPAVPCCFSVFFYYYYIVITTIVFFFFNF